VKDNIDKINLIKEKINMKEITRQTDKEKNKYQNNNSENKIEYTCDNYNKNISNNISDSEYGDEENKEFINEYNVIFKNVKYISSGNIIIEEEPMDMNKYKNYPFSKILNNCQIQNYEWELFPCEVAANQLKQETGNCYMVSALESIPQIPGLLDYIFDNNFSSDEKSFQINFRQKNQKLESYIVKNDFPVENNELKFIKPLEKEAYAIIFEKVWAVIRGGYCKIKGGKTYEVINKIFGISSNYLYNKEMGIFDIDLDKYKLKFESFDEKLYEDVRKSDMEWIKKISEYPYNQQTIDPKSVFDKIKKAEQEGGIITVSINMGNRGHAYSILGVDRKFNIITEKYQDFIILKNPWRSGNYIKEKIDIFGIEEKIKCFEEIIKINRKHYETGIFYMPKEYFEKWFRNILIYIPDYKSNFKKVHDNLVLYKTISNFYGIKSNKLCFDSIQGKNLIKTDVIFKDNFELFQKIIQQKNSNFCYVYNDKNELSSIWHQNSEIKNLYLNAIFVKKSEDINYELYKKNDITKLDFNDSEVYSSELSLFLNKNKCYRVITLEKINSLKEFYEKDSINKVYYNRDNVYDSFYDSLNKDILKLNRLGKEIKEFLISKYTFINIKPIKYINEGWVNVSPGINLKSDEYSNGHTHVHFYGESENVNLFELIGTKFKCSCYYINEKETLKECNQYFIFKNKVKFRLCTFYINGKKEQFGDSAYEYKLEREKMQLIKNSSNKGFYIDY